MENYQKQAWEWLLPLEQQSLYLTLGTGKSSWEVGEIMKLSHYKYLEIRERAETFMKMFVAFLEKHPSIFRPDGPCQEDFKDYIEAVICKRKTRKEARAYSGDSANLLRALNDKRISENLQRLRDSDNTWDHDTLKLILEFDRWNNFRVLPKMEQQPSAYKRRLNKKYKIYLNYIRNPRKFPKWLLLRIKERFHFRTRKKSNCLYIALISFQLDRANGYQVIPIKKDPGVVKEMCRYYFYVFNTADEADTFGFLVANYKSKTSIVRLGLKFWPEFRDIIGRAINQKAINNLDFNIKDLDNAFADLQDT